MGAVIDAAGLRLADACALVLDETVGDSELRRAILAYVGREPLERAVLEIREFARPAEEGYRDLLLGSYTTVRRFLPALLDTLEFEATAARRRRARGARRALRRSGPRGRRRRCRPA